MKNALKSLSLLMVLGGLIFISSCSDDDGGIDIGGGDEGSFTVADGLYIAGVANGDTTAVSGNKLNATMVEDDGFATKERSGHFSAYAYLEAGSYIFIDVADQQATDVYGGATSTYNDDEADNTDDYNGAYTVVDLSGDASTFSVSETGVYNVIFDAQTDEALLVKIDSWGVIGGAVFSDACTSDGFNADVDLDAAVSTSAEGSTYEGEGIILKDAEFKFRYNDSWKIDRRTDKSSFDDANGYVALTNLGGTPDALVEGGSNIGLSDNSIENGIYDITVSIDDSGVVEMSLEKTGDAPECAFDPENYTWGIIGSGTQGTEATAGWEDDKDLIYTGQSGTTHTWRGVFPIAGGTADNEFKFRTDETWATKLIPNAIEYTDNSGNITDNADSNGDGSWFVADGASGFYYIVITTDDNGDTWNLTIDDAEFQVIGEGSPVGNWDAGNGIAMTYNDDLASATLASGAYTTAGWKIFVNQSFDYNLGGSLDGTTALEFNNSTFNMSDAGDYSVTISTSDGGVTYNASATAN
ncbi:hypothetical protein [Ekhidna sp.]|uniref:hypothetical protein n=1 Tax=Ekhidna sp. TaxID=2608089 RepID=UPI003CCBB2D1